MKNREEITTLIADKTKTVETDRFKYMGKDVTVVYIADTVSDFDLIGAFKMEHVTHPELVSYQKTEGA